MNYRMHLTKHTRQKSIPHTDTFFDPWDRQLYVTTTQSIGEGPFFAVWTDVRQNVDLFLHFKLRNIPEKA